MQDKSKKRSWRFKDNLFDNMVLIIGLLIILISFFIQISWVSLLFRIFGVFGALMFIYSKTVNNFFKSQDIMELVINYVLFMLSLGLIYSFVYLFVFMGGFGYLRFGNCDESFVPRNLSTIEVSEQSYNYFYFSFSNILLSPYGDICPMGNGMRFASLIQMTFSIVISLFFIPALMARILQDKYDKLYKSEIHQLVSNVYRKVG